jgi:hypothetical protein
MIRLTCDGCGNKADFRQKTTGGSDAYFCTCPCHKTKGTT